MTYQSFHHVDNRKAVSIEIIRRWFQRAENYRITKEMDVNHYYRREYGALGQNLDPTSMSNETRYQVEWDKAKVDEKTQTHHNIM